MMEEQKGCKRKHRWSSAEGQVIAIRLSDTVYGILEARAAKLGLPKSVYGRQVLERELTRSHHQGKGGKF